MSEHGKCACGADAIMRVALNDHRSKFNGPLCRNCADGLYYSAYKSKREAWEFTSDWHIDGHDNRGQPIIKFKGEW